MVVRVLLELRGGLELVEIAAELLDSIEIPDDGQTDLIVRRLGVMRAERVLLAGGRWRYLLRLAIWLSSCGILPMKTGEGAPGLSLEFLDDLWLWEFGEPIYAEGAGFRQSGWESVEAGYVLIPHIDSPLLWNDGQETVRWSSYSSFSVVKASTPLAPTVIIDREGDVYIPAVDATRVPRSALKAIESFVDHWVLSTEY